MPKYIDFQLLKQEVSIEQVFPMLDLDMKKSGDQWRGECPVCEGGPRALVVTKSKQAWYCHGCKEGGDLISLVAAIRDLPMKEAAFEIAEQYSTESGNSTSSQRNKTRKSTPEAQGVKEPQKFQPLSHLVFDHDMVTEIGFEPEDAEELGVGYAKRGIMRGTVAVPIRLPDGSLVGYIGITEAKLPPRWQFQRSEDGTVVQFPKRNAS